MSGHHRQGDRAYQYFALIGIDRDGTLRHETSPSIARSREAILSPQVTHEFLRAVARSREMVPSHSHRRSHTPVRSTWWLTRSSRAGRTNIAREDTKPADSFTAANGS